VAVYLTSLQGAGVGLPLAIAIAAHNIPEGMAVAAPIFHATGSRWQAFKWSLVSGMCEPVGAIVVGLLLTPYLTPHVIKTVLAGVAGVMTFMCFHELVPQSLKYISSDAAMVSNVCGMVFISLSVWILQEKLAFKII
jgi:ZIP family zinc transporter